MRLSSRPRSPHTARPMPAVRSRGVVALSLVTTATLAVALHLIFVRAPVEATMGVVQKIFYFHVPSVYAMYVGFLISSIGGGAYLWKRAPKWEALAAAGAEVGVLFTMIVLITGPIWARKAWGVWWTWDPRLTTTLLTGLIYVAALVLRSTGDARGPERRFASALCLLGIPNSLLIHFSVQRWRGQHPEVLFRGGGISADMRPALYAGFLLMTFVAALLIWMRTRTERQRQTLDALEQRAAENGLWEDA